MKRIIEYIDIGVLSLTGVVLIGLQIKLFGWGFLLLGLFLLLFCTKQFRKDFFLIYICLALLGITPITTDISYLHIVQMGIPLILAITIPYIISRYVYKDYLVRFKFHHGRAWYKKEIAYILFTAVIAYFVIPFYLQNTNAYLNWTV